jgi:hypothetical protein
MNFSAAVNHFIAGDWKEWVGEPANGGFTLTSWSVLRV